MNIDHITQEILQFAGTFNMWLVLSLFFLCIINEAGLSIPYLMEAIWILVGYHALSGTVPVYQVILLWLSAVAGRMVGAMILYKLLGLGSTWIMKTYRKIFGSFLGEGKSNNNSLPMRLMRRINLFSPFSVALGRLMWLKVPLTLLLSLNKKPLTMLAAIILSSAIWDGTYIIVGVIGGNSHLAPGWFVLCSMGALTLLYGLLFVTRQIIKLTQSHLVK